MTKEEEAKQKRRAKEDIRDFLNKARRDAKGKDVKFTDVAVAMKQDLSNYSWIKNMHLGKDGDLIELIEETDLKAMAHEFEIEVANFMEDIGFDPVRGTDRDEEVWLDAKENGKVKKRAIQIDAMGLFDNMLFVVDAKLTKNPKGVYLGTPKALTNEIKDHAGSGAGTRLKKLKKEIDAVRDGNATTKENENILRQYADIPAKDLKYYGVMALHKGIRPNKQQKDLLYDYEDNPAGKIYNWDHAFIKYYQELSDNIDGKSTSDKYAMYDMLGEMGFSDKGEVEIAYCLEAEMTMRDPKKIRKVKTYQFVMDPKKLMKIATVARRHRPGEQFYQRELKPGRLEDIAEDLQDRQVIPNNIIVGMNRKVAKLAKFVPLKLEYTSKSTSEQNSDLKRLKDEVKKSTIPIRLGTLTFPRKYRSLWIIDGQHRLYGVIKTYKNGKSILKRPVKMAIVVFAGMEEDTMAEMFLTINDKQESIRAELKYDLYAEYLKEKPEGVVSRIVKALNGKKGKKEVFKTGLDSVLKGRIFYPSYLQDEDENPANLPGKAPPRIGINPIYDAIKRSRLTEDVILNKNKAKNISALPNPLFRSSASNKTKVKYVAQLIATWYNVLDEVYTPAFSLKDKNKNPTESPHKGMIFQQQVCQLWIHFLRQIVIHEDTTPSKTNLRRYAKALGPFMKKCIASPAKAKGYQDAAAHYSQADDVRIEMAHTVRTNPDDKLRVATFGDKTNLLDPEEKSWATLERLYGRYIQAYHKDDWKKKLSNKRQYFIENTAKKEKKREYNCLEMVDVEIILDCEIKKTNTKNLQKMARNFAGKTTNFESSRPSSLEADLASDVRQMAQQFYDWRDKGRVWKPGPSMMNETRIDNHTTALTQILGATGN